MAQATRKKSSEAAESKATHILDKLAAADESITRVSEDAKARKAERAKEKKRSESDAKARRAEQKAVRQAQQKQSDMIAQQKLAAFQYAENYRKKLLKDKEKMMSAAKLREAEVKAEAEAAAKEARDRAVAEIREREREEAEKRSERASALLNRVTKCAVTLEDGSVRMVDRAELARIEAEKAREAEAARVAKAAAEAAEAEARAAAEPEIEEPETVTNVAYPDKDELISAIVAAVKHSSPLFAEYEQRAREEIAARRVEEFFEGEMMDTRDGKFVLNIIEDDYTVALTSADDDSIASAGEFSASTEAVADGVAVSGVSPIAAYYPTMSVTSPVSAESSASTDADAADETADDSKEAAKKEYSPVEIVNHEVLELREMAESVVTRFDLWKYLYRVKKVTKRLKTRIDGMTAGTKSGNGVKLPSAIMQEVLAFVDLLLIRCDAVSACVSNSAMKKAERQAQLLYVEIDGYNDAIALFRAATGEELTRVSSFLPEHLLAATGLAVIPLYEFRERFVEVMLNPPKKKNTPYTFVFPSLKDMANGKPVAATPVDPDSQSNENNVSTIAVIGASVSAQGVYGEPVDTVRAYKKFIKASKKIVKVIDKSIANIEASLESFDGDMQMPAADLINLEKEKLLLAFHRLANSIKTNTLKYTIEAKRYVLDALREYNDYAIRYSEAVGIELAKFSTALPEIIVQTGRVPEIPRLAYCIELFETVGNETRLVGERDENPDTNGYTFVFGDYTAGKLPPKAPQPHDPASGKNPTPITPDDSEGAPEPATLDDKDKKGKKKYMAASDFDTVYLTIPFDMGNEDVKPGKNKSSKKYMAKKNDDAVYLSVPLDGDTTGTVYAPDVPVTVYTSEDETPSGVAQTTVSVVTHTQPVQQPQPAYQQQTAPKGAPAVITQETLDTLTRALSDAVKIAEYAKAAEQYAITAERAAKAVTDSTKGEDRVVYTDGIYENTAIPQPIVMETPTRSNGDRIRSMAKTQIKSFIANTERKLQNARREYSKALALKEAGRPDAKPRLIVGCLSAQKNVIDALSDILAAYSNIFHTDGINRTKEDLLLEINRYNDHVAEYEKLTNGKLTVASVSMIEDIISGQSYQSLPRVKFTARDKDIPNIKSGALMVTEESVPAPSKELRIFNKKQLAAYLSRRESEYVHNKQAYVKAMRRRAGAREQERAIAIVDAIIAERNIINGMCEDLLACCQVSAISETAKAKRRLNAEIKEYNNLVKELESVSGDVLSPAPEDMAQEIISGMPYQPLPEIKYSIANPVLTSIDKINKAIDEGKELYRDAITKEGHLNLGDVQSKVAGQANKDVAVVSHCAAFEVSLLESERDIVRYGHGRHMPRFGKQRKQIAKKIAQIKRRHKKAIKYAEADNERYYQVVMNNPATVKTKNPKPNRKKLAELRARMIALLNERDKINSKLTSIYTGAEYNLDGTGINQSWRRIKADAAERECKRQRYVEREIRRLPASESEKERIYELMNRRLDAVSTIALCKHRLRKEHLRDGEYRRIERDMRDAKKLIKQLDFEIKVEVKRILKRYKESYIASAWLTGMGFFLLFALVCFVAYAALFNTDIIEAVRWVKSLLGM